MTATPTTDALAGEQPIAVFGTELILNLGDCDPLVIRHADALAHWATTLAKRIGMECWGDPIVQRFGEGSLYGATVIQLITTSNILVHGVDAFNSAYVNVFSCRPFDFADAADYTIKYFRARGATARRLVRSAPAAGIVDLNGI